MAKSIRSKWKRKCRAVKRIRYGQKELDRLKKTLGMDEKNKDIETASVAEIANVISKKDIALSKENSSGSKAMDVDQKRIFNPKTMRDQYGSYPVWMHQRRIRKNKKNEKKKNSKRK